MSGVIVTGGMAPEFDAVKDIFANASFIIAADSGLDTLSSYGLKADYVLGDMDSLKDKSLLDGFSKDKIQIFDEAKDFTDTELAFNYLLQNNIAEIVIIGGGGGRFDHQIALYSLFSRKKSPVLWITHEDRIYLVEKEFSIEIERNTLVSLFPVGNNPCRMTSHGLKWELDKLNWSTGDSGISNIALNETIMINMISGRLIMIIPLNCQQ